MFIRKVITIMPLIGLINASISQTLPNGLSFKLGYGLANSHNQAVWNYSDESAKDGQLALASIGYTKNFEKLNLTTELFTFIGPSDSGNYSTYNTVYRTKNIWGVSLNPEFKLNGESIGYLKLGYAFAKSQQADDYGSVDYGSTQGGLYGFGVKLPMSKDIFIGLESFRIGFSRTDRVYSTVWSTYTTNKPNVTFSSVYIGRNF